MQGLGVEVLQTNWISMLMKALSAMKLYIQPSVRVSIRLPRLSLCIFILIGENTFKNRVIHLELELRIIPSVFIPTLYF